MRRHFIIALFVGVCACAGSHEGTRSERVRATSCAPTPDSEEVRRAALTTLGELVWESMRAGEPDRLLYDELDLSDLLSRGAATRIRGRRLHIDQRLHVDGPNLVSVLATAEFAGVCLQGARSEPAAGPLGLSSEAWVFDRVLLIGTRGNGQRVAAWVEGIFVYSNIGFRALDLERVEMPRWEHSDLELAPCDLAIRHDLPEIAR